MTLDIKARALPQQYEYDKINNFNISFFKLGHQNTPKKVEVSAKPNDEIKR